MYCYGMRTEGLGLRILNSEGLHSPKLKSKERQASNNLKRRKLLTAVFRHGFDYVMSPRGYQTSKVVKATIQFGRRTLNCEERFWKEDWSGNSQSSQPGLYDSDQQLDGDLGTTARLPQVNDDLEFLSMNSGRNDSNPKSRFQNFSRVSDADRRDKRGGRAVRTAAISYNDLFSFDAWEGANGSC
jgi:hypothetical protein